MKRLKKFGPNMFKPKSKIAMPRMKKFADGGDVEFGDDRPRGMTDYASSGSAGGSNISFNDAFREARKAGLKTFKWRNGTYGTKLASEGSKPKAEEPASPRPRFMSNEEFLKEYKKSEPSERIREEASKNVKKASEQRRSPVLDIGGESIGTRSMERDNMAFLRGDISEDELRERRNARAAGAAIGATGVAAAELGIGALGTAARTGALGTAARTGAVRTGANATRVEASNAARAAADRAARRQAANAARNEARREARASAASQRAASKPPAVQDAAMEARRKKLAEAAGVTNSGRRFASGGSVKRYAKGGTVRGGGCETKGKTRGKFV